MQTTQTSFKFTPTVKKELIRMIDKRMNEVYKEDFSELKSIVKNIAKIQERTEIRLEGLTKAQERTGIRLEELTKATEIRMEELAEAQKGFTKAQERTEIRMEELAEAQKGFTEAQERTEIRMEEFAEAQKGFTKAQERTEIRMEELAEAQKGFTKAQERTEIRMEELAESQKGLTKAQERTEIRMEELTEAQKGLTKAQERTEIRMEELTEAQKRTEIAVQKIAIGLDATRTDLGGLSRSVSYALENEAYRQLPAYLKETYGFEVTDRMVRMELEGEEINIFARAKKDGKNFYIVGEAELKLSSVSKLKQLEKNVSLVKKHYGGESIPLMITHFAKPQVFDKAKEKGIIIVQSFEW